jgi:hypothetical protein
MFADTHRSIARVVSIGVLGIALLAPCSARAQSAAEHDDAELVLAEPDFRVLNLPSTLRLPLHGSNFELTHRFNGNLRRGGFSEQASNLFGLDEGAAVGFEYRFGIAPHLQAVAYRTAILPRPYSAQSGRGDARSALAAVVSAGVVLRRRRS